MIICHDCGGKMNVKDALFCCHCGSKNLQRINRSRILSREECDKEFDRIIGLEKGSDDYITKPFSTKELGLRVNKIIQRTYRQDNTRIHIDGYEIDESQRMVYDKGQQVELTTKEFDLLMLFVKNKGTAFLREQILEQVWDTNYFGSDRVVDDTLRRLRKKMPNLSIHTIYGFGYRLG